MTTPKAAARAAEDSTGFRIAARIGYIVLGIIHLVIGGIAISIATGGVGVADQSGAMEQIRAVPAGVVLLWVTALGLVALAAWQIIEAILERDPETAKKWGKRAKLVGTAIVYLAIAGTAIVYALGGRSDSSETAQTFSAQLMAAPAGVFVIGLVGVGIAAIGVAFVVRGVTRRFEKNLRRPNEVARKGIVTFGVVGYIAKGIAVAIVGILFVVAAVAHDPENAGGLDTALHSLAQLPFGTVILWVVGAGLGIYGLFCIARARYARM
ncbi:DUF1206 domain-containing protein [Microbacterium sp. SS28]|uniref:DUF1206 domain-containing protein n=1 Tax=Microbacterium sp. SS28 TaxID=2919948 RepID=UPI001FA9A0CF|nr:DUF1206 domain-containing protein [Microbacterium sp. SS28]